MIKVNKTVARKAYDEDRAVFIIPNKINPISHFGRIMLCKMEKDNFTDFDKFINAYSYYNCNPETGNGIAYYIGED